MIMHHTLHMRCCRPVHVFDIFLSVFLTCQELKSCIFLIIIFFLFVLKNISIYTYCEKNDFIFDFFCKCICICVCSLLLSFVWRCLSLCVGCPSVLLALGVVSSVPVYLCLSLVVGCLSLCCALLLCVAVCGCVCVEGGGGSVYIERVFPCVLPRPHVWGRLNVHTWCFQRVTTHTTSHTHTPTTTTTATTTTTQQRQRQHTTTTTTTTQNEPTCALMCLNADKHTNSRHKD